MNCYFRMYKCSILYNIYSIFSSKLTFKSWILTSEKSCTSCPNWGEGAGGWEVIWTKFKRTTVFFRESVPYRCRTFQIEIAINYKRENIWLKLFQLEVHPGYQWLFHPQFCGRLHCRWYLYVLHWRHHIENKGLYCLLLIFSCFIKMEKILFILQEITVSGPDGTQEKIEVPIWNGTAANIILMSLGPRYFLWLHLSFVYCIVYFISCVIALQPIS